MRNYAIMLLFLLTAFSALAQKPIKGLVKDHNGKAIESVNVSLKDAEGNIINLDRKSVV